MSPHHNDERASTQIRFCETNEQETKQSCVNSERALRAVSAALQTQYQLLCLQQDSNHHSLIGMSLCSSEVSGVHGVRATPEQGQQGSQASLRGVSSSIYF